jgi:hypothetical protein
MEDWQELHFELQFKRFAGYQDDFLFRIEFD